MSKKSRRKQVQVVPPPSHHRETIAWFIVLGICAIIMAYCVTYLATHPRGRSSYPNGRDIYLIDAKVESIALPDGANRIAEGLCYVTFGNQGSLLLDDEWVEKFQIGESYNLLATNRKGTLKDRIVSYEWRQS